MKNIFLLTGLLITMVSTAQEDRWKITLNGRVLLNTTVENETKNIKRISRSEWNKNGKLEIRYYAAVKSTWKRSFFLNDENDNQLFSADSVNYVKVSLATLRKLFKGKKEIRIYTILIPDPALTVRIRRAHLCTLRLL